VLACVVGELVVRQRHAGRVRGDDGATKNLLGEALMEQERQQKWSVREERLRKLLKVKAGDKAASALVDAGVMLSGAVAWYFGMYQFHLHHAYYGIAHLPRKSDTIPNDVLFMVFLICASAVSVVKWFLLLQRPVV
jgi:hypothetical protein